MSGNLIIPSVSEAIEAHAKATITKSLALENAMKGGDVNEIYRAQTYIQNIQPRETAPFKTLLFDPMEFSSSFGYRDKPFSLSYDMLRGMAKTHIIKAIIETRKEQVQQFCEPQANKYATGFIITKKQKYGDIGKDVQLTKAEQSKVEYLIQFILDCGTLNQTWHADTFDVFIGKFVEDLLVLDQGCFETQRNRRGEPIGFFHGDGASFRIADTYMDDEEHTKYPEKVLKGYLPSYVQLYMTNVVAEYYPWELCFGVMNPQTSMRNVGYGKSPLEDMISTVTSILNSDAYNANFFKVGSSPKGIIRYSGNINTNTLDDFRQQWQAQVAGVMNSHKTPIINADKMDFINTHIANKDMEFSKFQEFLIKISCAQYKMDPSEIGFNMKGESGSGGGLGGSSDTDEKVKHSKDKGLKPLLKRIQFWINKYVISQIDENYEFKFVGIDQSMDPQQELENDIKEVSNITTLNEVRAKRNLPPLPHGDMPLNPVYAQQQMMQQQQEMQNQQQQQGGGQQEEEDAETDPFNKSLKDELAILLA